MPQQIQLNIIPFSLLESSKVFAFYSEKVSNSYSIKWDKLFTEFPTDRAKDKQHYYCTFQLADEHTFDHEIEFTKAINFSTHYFTHLVFTYFRGIEGAIVFPNYVDDIEVWFKDESNNNKTYNLYNKYTLKVQYNAVVEKSFELMVAYNGTSKVLKQSIADLGNFDDTKYRLINCSGTIYKYGKIPEELSQDQTKMFPVLSNELKKDFDIYEEFNKENRYPIYYSFITDFCNQYLFVKEFSNILKLQQSLFVLPAKKEMTTKYGANKLQFRDDTDYNPFIGITEKKPLKSFSQKPIKLFFIYNKADGEFVKEHLYLAMVNGWKGKVKGVEKTADPLHLYINQPYSFDKEKQVSFENNDTIFEEVSAKLDQLHFDPAIRYMAIYITPIKKDDKLHPQHNAYYKIKELLLNKEISSQVIYKEHIDKPDFYYFIPNIYVALLAKMGGIPWRLQATNENELIVGVGAFKPKGFTHRFLGSAFCFNNEGVFQNFNCFRDNEPDELAGSISEAVKQYKAQNKEAKRLIIHFYKEISNKDELQPILNMLDELGEPDMPVIVITINKTESRELLGFDLNSEGKMPKSGTFTSVGFNKFLLFNNTRYFDKSKLLKKDYHFPIKLSFKSSKPDELTIDVMKELINQVYQFSRMYWKSVSQQNPLFILKW